MQKVQDKMLAEVQGWCRGAEAVQGRCRWCSEGAGEVQVVQGGADYLHRLHLSKHNIRCSEVQVVCTGTPQRFAVSTILASLKHSTKIKAPKSSCCVPNAT